MNEHKKRRCQGFTRAGNRCRAWALRDGPNPDGEWLCSRHAEQARQEIAEIIGASADTPRPAAPAATAVPSGTWAGAHGRRQLYGIFFAQEEVAGLEAVAAAGSEADSLAAEIELVRVLLRRLLAEATAPGALQAHTLLILEGAQTVAALLRAKKALSTLAEAEDDGTPAWFGEAIDILSERWGVEL